MRVICIEGCHGSGKTNLCQILKKRGYNVLDEGFIDMPSYPPLSPQSTFMETMWVISWFKRLLTKPKGVYFTDRSPYSAIFYASTKGEQLKTLIQTFLVELQKSHQLELYTVYLKVESGILWDRITQRLEKEPFRKLYNEDKKEWMLKTLNFYDGHSELWNLVLINQEPIEKVVDLLISKLFS